MKNLNSQLKEIIGGTETNDAVTLVQMNSIPRIWVNGVQKTGVKGCYTSATVSSGTVIFNLTTDGTTNGAAIFNNVYQASMNWWVNDATVQYQVGGYTISGNKKQLTLTMNKLGTVLLGIIQTVAAANGVTVYLSIYGD